MAESYQFQLGEQIPKTPHAVCVHFPQLEDVIGYEEGNPEIVHQLKGGYPRFVLHPFIEQLGNELIQRHGLEGYSVALLPSRRAAREVEAYVMDDEGEWFEDEGLFIYRYSGSAESRKLCREFLQHTGCSISSRMAEDRLVDLNVLERAFPEPRREERPSHFLRHELAQLFFTGRPDFILLCNSGMNAFYSTFKAVRDLMVEEDRNLWLQIGWLYLDTTRVLECFTNSEKQTHLFLDIQDQAAVERFLERYGHQVAGCVTEVPTNPLLQTMDLDWLRNLADRYGFILILDPSMVSPYNIDILRYADVLVTSLTKYVACEGDGVMGAAIFNTGRPLATELLARTVGHHEPPYLRDLQRIALEVAEAPKILKRVNQTVALIASFLQEHPAVEEVYWAYAKPQRKNYERYGRWPLGPGCVVSFTLKIPMREFYDRYPLVKGPSFGTKFSILCPYLYLAHYQLVSENSGRNYLKEAGLDPELIRLSVGLESPAEIIAALQVGFGETPDQSSIPSSA